MIKVYCDICGKSIDGLVRNFKMQIEVEDAEPITRVYHDGINMANPRDALIVKECCKYCARELRIKIDDLSRLIESWTKANGVSKET